MLVQAAEDLPTEQIDGEWMGFLKVSASAMPAFRTAVAELLDDAENQNAKLYQLLMELIARGQEVQVVYTTGHWLDVDSLDDLIAAGSFT